MSIKDTFLNLSFMISSMREIKKVYIKNLCKGCYSIFLIHIHLPWDSISLFKNDCYSYELKLIKDDGILDFILKALGIAIDKNVSSSKTNQKKRKCNPSSSIRTSASVDFDSVFQKPFELSVLLKIHKTHTLEVEKSCI